MKSKKENGRASRKKTADAKKRLPFGGGRKKKSTVKKTATSQVDEEIYLIENEDELYSGPSGSPADNFFYTNDRFIAAFEDSEISNFIRQDIPRFGLNDNDEISSRRGICEFLQSERTVQAVMNRFGMDIEELVKYLFRIE